MDTNLNIAMHYCYALRNIAMPFSSSHLVLDPEIVMAKWVRKMKIIKKKSVYQ